MAAAVGASLAGLESSSEVTEITLLDLVRAVSEVTDDEQEIVATVRHLLRTRRARLCGILRGTPPDEL